MQPIRVKEFLHRSELGYTRRADGIEFYMDRKAVGSLACRVDHAALRVIAADHGRRFTDDPIDLFQNFRATTELMIREKYALCQVQPDGSVVVTAEDARRLLPAIKEAMGLTV